MCDLMMLQTIQAWTVVIGPIIEPVGYFWYISRQFGTFFSLLVAVEASFFRLLIDRLWKRAPPINDEFFNRFLTLFNSVIALLIPLVNILCHDSIKGLYHILGQEVPDLPDGRKPLKINLVLKVIATCGLLVSLSMASRASLKIQRWWQSRKASKVSVHPGTASNMEMGIRTQDNNTSRSGSVSAAFHAPAHINNQGKNPQLVAESTGYILGISGILFMLPSFLLLVVPDKVQVSQEEIALVAISRLVSFYIVIPSVITVRNKRMRNYLWSKF